MGCGCKKNKVQQVNVSPVQVSVNETTPQPQNNTPTPILTPEQQQQVDNIMEKINNLNTTE